MKNQSIIQKVRNQIREEVRKSKLSESSVSSSSILRQYLETALWSSSDDSDEPFDQNYGINDIAQKSIAQAKKDLADFLMKAKKSLPKDVDLSSVGHDFWLSRSGHGSGFFDADYLEDDQQKTLQALAGKFREITPVIGDDGKIHFE